MKESLELYDIDNQKIIRRYCPLLQEFSEEYQEDRNINENSKVDKMFWILVKIYKDGFMSKYLVSIKIFFFLIQKN